MIAQVPVSTRALNTARTRASRMSALAWSGSVSISLSAVAKDSPTATRRRAVVTYWLTVLASRGARWAYLRVRIISVIVPIAIIAIDGIPGALPAWFVAMQIAGALALVPAAFIVNRSGLRAAFPKSR